MRIISGTLGGIRLNPPRNLPVRPTTDLAKGALFNILENNFDFSSIKVLDLFCGTGNISFEFASRACPDITSVDKDYGCVNFVKETAKKYEMPLHVFKADVIKFLKGVAEKYDMIFADPPYDFNEIHEIPKLVFEKGWIENSGWLIIEHASFVNMSADINYQETRTYGQSAFSIFKN